MRGPCKADDCERTSQTRAGYCIMHYKRWKRNGEPVRVLRKYTFEKCETEGCDKYAVRKGLCKPCSLRMLRRGTTERAQAPHGSGCLTKAGYRVVTIQGEREYEHRVKAQPKPGEVVHHKDGNRSNNDLDNLEILPSQSEHMKLHQAERRLQK